MEEMKKINKFIDSLHFYPRGIFIDFNKINIKITKKLIYAIYAKFYNDFNIRYFDENECGCVELNLNSEQHWQNKYVLNQFIKLVKHQRNPLTLTLTKKSII